MQNHNLIIILGATASGKTKLAVQVADAIDGEIISADSRQVFKQMDIGTGKDLDDYRYHDKNIPYHLIDILSPGESYHVDAFKNDFFRAFESIGNRGKTPILCGGTGMYIHSLLQNQIYTAVPSNLALRADLAGLEKEELAQKLAVFPMNIIQHADLSSKKRLIRAIEIAEFLSHSKLEVINRPVLKPIVFGLKNEVEITRSKIIARLDERLNSGMIAEVENLIKSGVSAQQLIFYGLEYKFVSQYLSGIFTFSELKEKLGIAICQYAKRQNTFFRKMEKDGIEINWLDASQSTSILNSQVVKIIVEI